MWVAYQSRRRRAAVPQNRPRAHDLFITVSIAPTFAWRYFKCTHLILKEPRATRRIYVLKVFMEWKWKILADAPDR
jgi:hypothetical protein